MSDLFAKAKKSDVQRAAKLHELRRELAARQQVYPRLIQRNKLKPAEADRRNLILEAIIADYEGLA